MPGDYPAIIRSQSFSPGMWLIGRLWLGTLLLVWGTTLIGPFIGSGVPRKAIPSVGLLLTILRNFIFWLRTSNKLSVSAVLGYRSMISADFRSGLSETSTSPVLHALSCGSTCWIGYSSSLGSLKVGEYLMSPVFDPLHQSSLRDLTR